MMMINTNAYKLLSEKTRLCKWKGNLSYMKNIHGGGPQWGFFGILEYLSQFNDNCETVNQEDKFKFVDDLTALEIVNLLSIGMSNFNVKISIPNDIWSHNGYTMVTFLKKIWKPSHISVKFLHGLIKEN